MYQNQENSTILKGRTCGAAFLLLFMLTALPPAVAQQDPCMPGTIEGTGTYFEITDSEYLNITLTSTEPVHLSLESVPQMVLMEIEAAEGTTPASTSMTLTGFIPLTTYYQYQDDYHNGTAITTDANGCYTYQQDLTTPHLVFIQSQPSTIFIPTDISVGTWDSGTRTYTLTTDVYETIQIDEDNLTLDGAGYIISGPGPDVWAIFGVYLNGKTGVTLQNLDVQGFSTGIFLYYSNANTLDNNSTTNNNFGIHVRDSSNNILTGNTANSNNYGIYPQESQNNTLTDNTANTNSFSGIHLWLSNNNTMTGNTTNLNGKLGIRIGQHGSLRDVPCNNTLTGNTANSNDWYGIRLFDAGGNTLISNTSTVISFPAFFRVKGRRFLLAMSYL